MLDQQTTPVEIAEIAREMKLASPEVAATSAETRNAALAAIKEALAANADAIFEANETDLAAAEADGVAPAIVKRLRFDQHKLDDVMAGINEFVAGAEQFDDITMLCMKYTGPRRG